MERGDLVIYSSDNKPRVGKFVNLTPDRKIIIVGKNQNRKIRDEKYVVSLNDLFEQYKPILEAKGELK